MREGHQPPSATGRQARTAPTCQGRTSPTEADGARLADLLSLSIDPTFEPQAPTHRMIEVYPHTALVALFNLPVTLKYKARAGRTLSARKDAFSLLFHLIEDLGEADPPMDLRGSSDWLRVRSEVQEATTQAALDRAEDEVDGYVCAYIALYYWTWGIERCAVIGGVADGYILTPVDDDARRRLDGLGRLSGGAS